MKTSGSITIIGFALLAVAHVAFAHGGGGGFGGGGHFGGGGFRGGGGFTGFGPHFGGGGFRYSFGGPPMYGRPLVVGASRIGGIGRPNTSSHSQTLGSFNRTRTVANSHSSFARTSQSLESARNHVFARHDGNWHRDWNRHGAHFWHGHWWAWDNGYWIGLADGFYPWDYYPYYAYDFYPYDYYPGYYAQVEPYYSTDGIYDSVPAPDPTVTAVQNNLVRLGYYRGLADGLYGQATRDAVAHYQADHQLAVTGTLTPKTLQLLGVSAVVSG